MSYKDLLKHPKWQKKRLRIFERDDFTCQSCSDTETCLHVHHRVYHKGCKPWEYGDEHLITLCADCHYHVTFYDSKKALEESVQRLIIAFRKAGVKDGV